MATAEMSKAEVEFVDAVVAYYEALDYDGKVRFTKFTRGLLAESDSEETAESG